MREILFKAKGQTDKKWYFGLPNYIGELTCEIKYQDINGLYKVAICDASTLCQYTGLTDKNGKKIFEGDIFHLGDRNITYTVTWHDTGLQGKQNRSSSYVGLTYWGSRIEIIGNIHDRSGNSEPDN